MNDRTTILEAKSRLPMTALLDRLAPEWRKKNPIRADDKRNSFGADDKGWHDHGPGGLKGDQITFLERFEGLNNSDAIRRFLELAGVEASRKNGHSAKPVKIDWPACVAAFTDDEAQKLADWRGYSLAFVQWLKVRNLIGIYQGQFALPLHDDAGNVCGVHVKTAAAWITRGSTKPLVIGDRKAAKWIIFESQWDAFAVMEALDYHLEGYEPSYAVLVTRGADNGKFASTIPANSEAIVIRQNDEEKNGRVAADDWLETIKADCPARLKVARPPLDVKDCNDWLRRGDADFNGMLAGAEGVSNPLDDLLDVRRFDLDNPPAKPVPVLLIHGKAIATAGNLVAVTSQAKAGKTAEVTAMMAATMEPSGDCLGITGQNPDGLAVVHFDTEQSPFDHHGVILQMLKRAGREQPPEWLRSYRLADVSTKDRRKALAHEMNRAAIGGKLRIVFVDGTADLCVDPNDPAEAFGLVEELHRLAITYDCPIVCVLHENPGSDTGKTRGHLGSQLERKSETNLRLSKDAEGITTVFTERSRHCHIPKESGPRFAWDEGAGMHLSVESAREEKTTSDDFHNRATVEEAFLSTTSLRYSDLKAEIMRIRQVKERRAEDIIRAIAPKFLRKNLLGFYERVTP